MDPFERWTSQVMRDVWSRDAWAMLARRIWMLVIEVQADVGSGIPIDHRRAYQAATVGTVDWQRIAGLEEVTQHDIQAHLITYNEHARIALHMLAPSEALHVELDWAHRGMTSADIVENVAQWQVQQSLDLVQKRSVAVLVQLAHHMRDHVDTPIVGRTHNVPAQIIPLGWRFAVAADEMLRYYHQLSALAKRVPTRGIRGAVGTNSDALAVFPPEIVKELDAKLLDVTGLNPAWCTAQEAPRSWDLELATLLLNLCSGASTLSNTIRLMAGQGLAAETFAANQVGSSAMPHKRNPRLSERIHGLVLLLRGLVCTAAGQVGDQWNEGDVSHSSTRRVLLPQLFSVVDAILITAARVLDGFIMNTAARVTEVEFWLPAVSTGRLMALLMERGVPRLAAHTILRDAAALSATGEQMIKDLHGLLKAEGHEIELEQLWLTCVVSSGSMGAARSMMQPILDQIDDAARAVECLSLAPRSLR